MGIVPILGVLIGIVVALFSKFSIPPQNLTYMAVAILAALDTIFGGIVANMERKFNVKIFLSGFFGNALLAAALTYIGKLLGVELYLAAVVVFGTRLFQNFAFIRRFILNKFVKDDIIVK